MMKKVTHLLLLFFFSFEIISLFGQSATLHYIDYKIDKQLKVDSSMIKMLTPYTDSVNHTMNKVIGFSMRTMMKQQPESILGNFMADCLKKMAEKKFNKKIDVAVVNYGGIRSYLPKGDISIDRVYELMPFDNLIVLLELKGNVLLQLLNQTAEKGGWPVAGITMKIKEKHAVDILIDNKPLDESATYVVAVSDYLANGGDDCAMLRNIPQLNVGYLFRDALVAYISQYAEEGKPIDIKVENRVMYVN